MRARRRLVVERRLRRKDGTSIEAEVSARQVEAGRILAIVQDDSERKRAEAALRQLSARVLQLQDEERRRIARELHDGTGQALTGLALKLAALLRTARLDRAARKTLRGAKKLAEQCARETRTLSYLLHPPLLEEAGLRAALAWLVEGFAERSGIRAHIKQPQDDVRLPHEVELALFRVVQEGLANVHRHSSSPTAEVRVAKRPGEVRVEIRDKGHGIPRSQLTQAMTRGVGIAGMRERLRELGGRLEVHSSPRGTTLRAAVPVAFENV
jgi:signal transduction histidine kinase